METGNRARYRADTAEWRLGIGLGTELILQNGDWK